MVQVPTGAAAAASMRDSPASGSNSGNTPARGKPQVNGTGYHAIPAPIHLSAMHSAPLDLTSVERRGQPTANRDLKKESRMFELPEAPTYRPTEEEFKDPYEYIKSIAPEASKYGICKIIPPDSWKPDFAIDTERFHFRTRKQELNSVEGSTRANLTYLDQLAKFHKQSGTSLTRFPSVDKRPLDLYKLKKAVESRGGFEKVCKLKKWAEIGRDLGYSGKIMSSLSTSLKNSYQRWLFPYEEYLRLAKPGVHQQLEYEYGGPLTPSPANSPVKKSVQNTPSSLRGESPAMRASDALNAHIKESVEIKNIPMLDTPIAQSIAPSPLPEPPRSGFTAVNMGGFTPVNASPAAFTPVNVAVRREREVEREFTPPRRIIDSPLTSAKNTPEYRPSVLGTAPVTNGFTSHPGLKRQLSPEGELSSKEDTPGLEDSGRRSKRIKKDAVPTVAGSHMSMFRPTAPKTCEPGAPGPGERCEQCGKADNMDKIMFCESCDNGFHLYCLDTPVQSKPGYDWYCSRCLVGDGQFGFEEGGIYSLKQFQQKAAEFKEAYFSSRLPRDNVLKCKRPVTEDDIEQEFWRLVASLEETVEVEYGADIHSTTHGSGFPTIEKRPRDSYATDPWNLTIMPYHGESLFRHIKSDISGMTVPWLYVGMIFSTFCWHNEDHYSYSANYQHFGSTKTWYGVPGSDADKFENAMREAVPELFETQPDLLFQLVTLLQPDHLQRSGVKCYALDQRAGQFVITFPQAYHGGFNHGFNFNEAVNFAPTDWEPFGDSGVERLQQFRRTPCFSHDELLWTAGDGAATGGTVTIQTAKWLAPALERMKEREMDLRKAFMAKHKEKEHPCVITDTIEGAGPRCHITFTVDESEVPEEEYQCTHCKAYAYLSRFKCNKSGKVMCLLHAGEFQCCDSTEEQRFMGDGHSLIYRHSEEDISAMAQKVHEKSVLPEQWEEKYNKAIDESATPSLKTLRSLLNEGERIPYDLPSLPLLKSFVERCNDWVEEAANYTVRKQQNRRKSEKSWRKNSKAAEADQRERELRKVDNVMKLLREADEIGFDCPEITQLRERADNIKSWQIDASEALSNSHVRSVQDFEDLLESGRGFNVDMPEMERIERSLDQMKWNEKAKEVRNNFLSLKDVTDMIIEGEKYGIPPYSDMLRHFKAQREAGEAWEVKAKELMSAESVHYPQLEALSNQAQAHLLPVSAETLAEVDLILNKQREAHRKILSLFERSKNMDPSERPKYQEVRETMENISELNSKPSGTLDLEKEQKRHEDWMRKGKKLFGKANAPLHILKSHMEYVLERNSDCFDIVHDKPRQPAEPASREQSPADPKNIHSWEDPRFREVFCICRKIEAGMMIECELCHEWYHGKCLKIARGKVKDDEKYTCPICDWRVKIPRDAARPKLEDLHAWQDEIATLPFIPDEEDVLSKIIDNAQEFRNHVAPYCNPIMPGTADEAITQRFFLRKIEGAEVLLTHETNFFRKELHKWQPVAPEAPPELTMSKSTRKPRPTKIQKLMTQHGVSNPDDLPQALRTKQHTFKRKSSEPVNARPQPLQPAPGRSDSGTPTNSHFPNNSGPGHMHHGPILSGVPQGHPDQIAYASRYPYQMSGPPGSIAASAYAPNGYMGQLGSPAYDGSHDSRNPAIFTGAALARNDPALGASTLDSPMRESFGAPAVGSSQVDRMFNELTNGDDDKRPESKKGFTEETLERLREGEKANENGYEGGRAAEEESEFLQQVGYESAWAGDTDAGERMDED